MMFSKKIVKRNDYSLLSQWFWRVDTNLLALFIFLAVMGAVISVTASPPVAERIGYGPFYFVYRQVIFSLLGMFVMVGISLLNLRWIRRLSLLIFIGTMVIMALLPIIGLEKNGAIRWLIVPILNISVQPSEFMKPAFIVVLATLLAEQHRNQKFQGYMAAIIILALVIFLLMIQPDLGMAAVILATGILMIYLAGFPILYFIPIIPILIGVVIWLWNSQAHFQSRILTFWENIQAGPEADLPYQVRLSMEALSNGGFSGVGPGAGQAKLRLPDAHTDYIFAVVGEEFGFIFCLLILALLTFIILRIFYNALQKKNLFVMLASSGLAILFAMQSLVNLASTLNVMPPKGMTLPFISYGGSSTIAIAYLAGMVLAFTKERPWDVEDVFDEEYK